MKIYNYRKAVKNDILDYIECEVNLNDFEDLEELREFLNDELFINDSVTGNACGSYTLCKYEAEENISHNLELLGDALEAFGYSPAYLMEKGAEKADVIIRCYLLSDCINAALEEIRKAENNGKN